jgi:hypothetical protein
MSNGLFRNINFKIGLVAAGLALSAGPVLAGQRPSEGAPSHGAAVERGSGGGGGSAAASTPSTPAASSPSSGSTAGSTTSSTPSAAASSPSFSGAARRAAYAAEPQHRGGSSNGGNNSGARGSGSHPSGGGERAVPRGTAPSGGNGGTSHNGGTTTTHSAAPANPNSHTADSNADRAVPNWSRPRGDRPATGTAVARTHPPVHDGDVIVIGGGYYNPFFPYGVGYPGYGLGLGFGLYDPWYDPFMYSGYGYGYGYGYGGYAGGGGADDYYPYNYGAQQQTPEDLGQGAIRLKVKPRDAKVYVDGVFVGEVDSFDGVFQKLNVGAGHHKVEVRADGYETAEFDVLVTPEQTVTYQGELKRIQ